MEVVFLGLIMESLLGEAEVWSRHMRITIRKSHKFWSDRWIALQLLKEFAEAVFVWVDMESLLDEAED
jgi:hypothetical protein